MYVNNNTAHKNCEIIFGMKICVKLVAKYMQTNGQLHDTQLQQSG